MSGTAVAEVGALGFTPELISLLRSCGPWCSELNSSHRDTLGYLERLEPWDARKFTQPFFTRGVAQFIDGMMSVDPALLFRYLGHDAGLRDPAELAAEQIRGEAVEVRRGHLGIIAALITEYRELYGGSPEVFTSERESIALVQRLASWDVIRHAGGYGCEMRRFVLQMLALEPWAMGRWLGVDVGLVDPERVQARGK